MRMQSFHNFCDYFYKIRNRLRIISHTVAHKKRNSTDSDSQNRFYVQSVKNINKYPRKFKKFRRIYDYREILEHVDYNLGNAYLSRIKMNENEILNFTDKFIENDKIGNPRRYNYAGIGMISPTTLRYISVATDLRRIFGKKGMDHVAEIGGGYGGQASILNKIDWFNQYSIYDLEDVQFLIKKFLKSQNMNNVLFPSIKNPNESNYDLVISNYAFSELPKELQLVYMEKILLRSKNGYLIMNSGRSNRTHRSNGKMSLAEIKNFIPNLDILEENPITGPDNYVIFWKS